MQALLTQIHDPLLLMVQRPPHTQTNISRLNHDFALHVALDNYPAVNVIFVQKGLLDDIHSFVNDVQTPLCIVFVHVIHVLYLDPNSVVTLEDNSVSVNSSQSCQHSIFHLSKRHTTEFNVQPNRQPSPTSTLHAYALLPLHSQKATYYNTTDFSIQLSLVLPVKLEKFNIPDPPAFLPELDKDFDLRSFLA